MAQKSMAKALLLAATLSRLVFAQNGTHMWAFNEIPPTRDLQWYPCNETCFCAMLQVPLDYTNLTLGLASVPLVKLPANASAATDKYKGIIITNPGGPSVSGVEDLLANGFLYQAVVGSNYDLVSFDPRGIQNSVPSGNCTLASTSRLRPRFRLQDPVESAASFESNFQVAKTLGEECAASIGGPTQAGPHMTTAVNVKDLVSILDAYAATDDGKSVGEAASLLNYWGLSYGTFIGQTFASMYPDRVGRVVLDGVVNAAEYTTVGIGPSSLLDSDAAFATFFEYCHLAGPTACAFYANSTRAVHARFERSISQLAQHQNQTNATATTALALALVNEVVFESAYAPITFFPEAAYVLAQLEAALAAGTLAQFVAVVQTQLPNAQLGNEQVAAVACADGDGRAYGLGYGELRPFLTAMERASGVAADFLSGLKIACTGWSINGTDKYSGPFGSDTKNPILFVSNTLDPITPITNSEIQVSNYKGARLLTIEGTGHASVGTQNKCAFAKMSRYFQTGQLPALGAESFCPIEAGPWGIVLNGTSRRR